MKKRNKYEILAFIKDGKPAISSVNPRIKKIIIYLDFSKNFEYSHKPYFSVLKPSDEIFYAPDCINRSCTKGYFDISSDLYDLVRNNKNEIKGSLTCDGWQDQERIGNHQCFAKVSYTIKAEFENEE